MYPQKVLNAGAVKSWKGLVEQIVVAFAPKEKTAIASEIGISPKQLYLLLAGNKPGVYTIRKLGGFLMDRLGYRINETKSGIELVAIPNFTMNHNNINIDSKFLDYLQKENTELKEKIKSLETRCNELQDLLIKE